MRLPAVGGERTVPAPDELARDYILLGLRLDQHQPGLVDAYFGPAALKAEAETGALPAPAALAEAAESLRARVARNGQPADRARWLDRQLIALRTHAERLAGQTIGYVEEVRRCFDAAPTAAAPGTYAGARAALDRLLPGQGDLHARLAAWDEQTTIPPDRLGAVIDSVLPRLRDATAAVLPIPDGESLGTSLVSGQPWGAYNWYLGGLRSTIDVNTDLPMRTRDLLRLLSHETFPGHHLEHALKERHLVEGSGRLEATLLLIDTPECYVSEGLADLGIRYVLDAAAQDELLRDIRRLAAVDGADDREEAARDRAIGDALHGLRAATGDAALRLHAAGESTQSVRRFLEREALLSPERAAKRLEFIRHPLWRTYVFSYAGGERLLRRWCEADGPDRAVARFQRLLTEQLTPSGLAADVAA
ncbi:MAG TPA: hypothetical protein VFK38_05930 [Candidatus Limnocylindrales bacterium]|nr:hypothetical protein [Candidatus Limnocylindrales bacterium]